MWNQYHFQTACPKYSINDLIPVSGYLLSKNNCDNGITDDVLKVRARAAGAEHEEILAKSDGYMTAWMLYQLCGDEEAAEVFIGENAEILNNPNWQDVEKNR